MSKQRSFEVLPPVKPASAMHFCTAMARGPLHERRRDCSSEQAQEGSRRLALQVWARDQAEAPLVRARARPSPQRAMAVAPVQHVSNHVELDW